jgi:hypothetical protein
MVRTCRSIKAHTITLFLLLGVTQCTEEKPSFYQGSMHGHDVWRLPIIEPYEVITADCCRGWSLQEPGFMGGFSPDSLNLSHGYILFNDSAHRYGFLDIKHKKTVWLSSYQQFSDSLSSKKISKKLYSTETVYYNWLKTDQLPWASEILAAQELE